MFNGLTKLLRAGEGRTVKRLSKIADQVLELDDEYSALTDAELKAKTDEFRAQLKGGASLDDILIDAFATAREASWRVLGQKHYKVQIMGGAALHFGSVAEMKTGEGKTLTSVLPAYLNALEGKGVHIVTVNDYLAKRDAEMMGRVHHFLGLNVGVILSELRPPERKEAYDADITYGTNNELGFDYLRDNMARSPADMVQRGHNFAIVDEVDSILIDEARTPLIISGPADGSSQFYTVFAQLAPRMREGKHYEVDQRKRTIGVTEDGVEFVEDQLGIDNLYAPEHSQLVSYLNNAIKAKENVEIKNENQTLATVTLQNFFRLYDKLAGMTGTAETEAAELHQIYKLDVVAIPPNKPNQRHDHDDLIYKTQEAKFAAVADDIAEHVEKGQPVLVGTTSVERSEYLSQLLTRKGIKHNVLNAKHHEEEGRIIAEAGLPGKVTVSTNMAGRGTDIVLGGNPEILLDAKLQEQGLDPFEDEERYQQAWDEQLPQAKERSRQLGDEVREAGGLYVIGTERHESRRIDNQLRGRSGRQGDPGESRFYLSMRDELMVRFMGTSMEQMMNRLNVPDDVPIEAKMVSNAIKSAQSRVENQNFEMRKNVLKYDEVLNEQRKVVYRERQEILGSKDIEAQVRRMIDETVGAYVDGATREGYVEDWDLDELWKALDSLYGPTMTPQELIDGTEYGRAGELTPEQLREAIIDDAQTQYDELEQNVAAIGGEEQMRNIERMVILPVMDTKWREHLYEMDYLKEGIGLRAMAQRDPLVEYQKEGGDMFHAMNEAVQEETVRQLFMMRKQFEQQDTAEV